MANFSTGPYQPGQQRKLSRVVYVDFMDQDVRDAVYNTIMSANMTFQHHYVCQHEIFVSEYPDKDQKGTYQEDQGQNLGC